MRFIALCAASASAFAPTLAPARHGARVEPLADGKANALRDRIVTTKNTKKITEAMRLVAAAKVRRAQEAVLQTRPFSETLQSVFGGLIKRLGKESVELPLLETREVKKVTLVTIAGDRGLCGSYNTYAIKKTQQRIDELEALGIETEVVTIGKKPSSWFSSATRENANVVSTYDCTQAPTAEYATEIADKLLSSYLSGETDAVELVYTKFVSLIASTPSIRTLLPLSSSGIEMEGDEIFQMTTDGGDFKLEKEEIPAAEPKAFPKDMIFEQDPVQILNAILPLYLNGQFLRCMQESVASELAARMAAMQSASDNAGSLAKTLEQQFNRARQASVTQELLEIVAGATALEG
jgi:F-type H+-transporting ATPase subunit gamma